MLRPQLCCGWPEPLTLQRTSPSQRNISGPLSGGFPSEEGQPMLEKLFGKVSDVVYHTIGPYAAERRQFLEHCRQQGYRKNYLKQIAGVLLSAASDLHDHGGLDVDRARLEAALARLETIRAESGFRRTASAYR